MCCLLRMWDFSGSNISKVGNNSAPQKIRLSREDQREGTEIGYLGTLNLNITTLFGKKDNFLPFNCLQMACLDAYSYAHSCVHKHPWLF